jgi:endonuclease/exonuclease/phosphatase family metal-dependent hydrolase
MTSLSVMTWNVRYFGHGSGGVRASDEWMRRMAWVLAGRPEIPDVIALQEVEDGSLRGGRDPQLARFVGFLHEALAAHHRPERFTALYFPAHRYALGETSLFTTGLATLVSDAHVVEAHNAEAPFDITHVRLRGMHPLKQRRIAARVRIRPHGGSPIEVINIHLSLPAFFEERGPHRLPERMGFGTNQLVEVENLLAWLDDLPSGPKVVLGDFNSEPGSPAHRRLVQGGLVDAWDGRVVDGGTASFLHFRMHLDHLFATPSVSWTRVLAHSVDHGPFRGLSDHAPKTGTLEVA